MRYLVILQAANPAGPPPEGLFEAIGKLGGEAAMAGALFDTVAVGMAFGPGKGLQAVEAPTGTEL